MKIIEKLIRLYFSLVVARLKVRATKLQALKAYVQAIQFTRLSALGLVAFIAAVMMAVLGSVMVLGGVVWLLPLTTEQRVWGMLILGFALCLPPILGLRYILSDALWLKKSGIQAMLRDLDRPSRPHPTPTSTQLARGLKG